MIENSDFLGSTDTTYNFDITFINLDTNKETTSSLGWLKGEFANIASVPFGRYIITENTNSFNPIDKPFSFVAVRVYYQDGLFVDYENGSEIEITEDISKIEIVNKFMGWLAPPTPSHEHTPSVPGLEVECSVNLTINKFFDGTEADFEALNLDPDETYNFKIRLTNLTTNEVFNVVINNKESTTIKNLPVRWGESYKIEEIEDPYFDFSKIEIFIGGEQVEIEDNIVDFFPYLPLNELKIVDHYEVGRYERPCPEAGCDYIYTGCEYEVDVYESAQAEMKVWNKPENFRYYEDKDEKENLFIWGLG